MQPPESAPKDLLELVRVIKTILEGGSARLLHDDFFGPVLTSQEALRICSQSPQPIGAILAELVAFLAQELPALSLQLLAIGLLQLFIQNNFTGPQTDDFFQKNWFSSADAAFFQQECVKLMTIEGKSAYGLMNQPFLLLLSLSIFENLQHVKHSMVSGLLSETIEEITAENVHAIQQLDVANSPTAASLVWWRARALQVHLSILDEPSDTLASVTAALLQQQVVNSLAPEHGAELETAKHVHLMFLLENARNGIHARTEHLAEPFLHKAAQVSQLQVILTGAKAKRTKFQTFTTASLILLAKSKESSLFTDSNADASREAFALNSDLLLERPHYESLDDIVTEDEPDSKKLRLDEFALPDMDQGEKLLPITLSQDDIPPELRDLDPNNQPALTDIDTIQLLLRLITIKQTSPSGSAMVEEELSAIVNRIIYSTGKKTNWSVFGRTLWERSILETSKARTVERGILQMTSLVEEVGINVKSRMIPAAKDGQLDLISQRLRFIHQLPLMPQWAMDSKLAEKYMSLGVLRSAIEIYERLNLMTDAALCYAAVDEEAQAEKLLLERISSHPQDARAISILGDIRQDPELWEKAWELGKYAKAKASLSKYYYNPPVKSGLKKDLQAATLHMRDSLSASPLSYENWFFYGCCGLESENYELAAEAFSRAVALDDTNSHAWSNLATALLRLNKTKQAFLALKKALQQGEGAKRSWRIFENYLTVAVKLNEWNDVLHAVRQLISIRKDNSEQVPVDIPVIERLVLILVEEPYTKDARPTHFQASCIDLVCNKIPEIINHLARLWRIVSRVEMWRGKPWTALDCFEKAYRATSLRPELDSSEEVWVDAVEACSDLVSAYESLGELPGKHGAGDMVCKDWKYKARTAVRSLMSKGKATWEDSEGWDRLVQMKADIANA